MGVKLGQGKKIEGSDFGPDTQDLEINLSKACKDGSVRLRLVGEVNPAYRYWVTNLEKKKRNIITPFFDGETETWEAGDPLASYSDAQKEFFYTINCIDRATGEMKILIIKRTVYQYIYSLAQDPEYGDPTDIENGYDLIISKVSTGPKPMNVKYEIRPGRNTTTLTEEEKGLELHNLAELYKPKSKEDYLEWVKLNTFAMTDNTSETVNETGEDDIPF